MSETQFQIAVDIGGTFTDGVLHDPTDDTVFVAKALTTNRDPGEAIEQVVRSLLSQRGCPSSAVSRVIHGTTLVTNTLVERRGARVALVLTAGTKDALDIRRELRYDIYDLTAEYPAALVAGDDRFELSARLSPAGEEWCGLDDNELQKVVDAVKATQCTAIAVCLLHSPVDDRHEQVVGAALRAAIPESVVSLSAEVAREIGEYERMSTVVANAYVQPVVGKYLATLGARLEALGSTATLDIMLSNGAFTNAALAAAQPIRILESGPAGGVLSAINCGADAGTHKVLAFDMGGTTAKASIAVDSEPSITHVFEFGRVQRFKPGSGLPAVAPSMDLIEIGAGGGSLASINALGLLQVGPQSAGSEPGPACYGLGGTQATVTDADLVLGFLDANNFLGGTMQLDVDRASEALTQAGAPLGLDMQATAWGIHD
ncbi:MAG: hydantoinase/oxoprolinase family protein, partial [Chromatiales bacterium]|nr:hydantoinase/oxoprolinase family protein [Chromatiales bacterium]